MFLNTNLRVLLVEDDALIQKIHRAKLENLGCKVDSAITGQQALEKFPHNYDLILLDWGLPDVDGVEICRRIRHYEHVNALPRVPIVMITAYTQTSETEQQCREAGVDLVIGKPIVEDHIWYQLVMRQFGSLVPLNNEN